MHACAQHSSICKQSPKNSHTKCRFEGNFPEGCLVPVEADGKVYTVTYIKDSQCCIRYAGIILR